MRALALFFILWFQYALLAVNTRAIAQGRYLLGVGTDALIAIGGFTLFKLIIEAGTPLEVAAYVAGGCLGGATGIWISKRSETK